MQLQQLLLQLRVVIFDAAVVLRLLSPVLLEPRPHIFHLTQTPCVAPTDAGDELVSAHSGSGGGGLQRLLRKRALLLLELGLHLLQLNVERHLQLMLPRRPSALLLLLLPADAAVSPPPSGPQAALIRR